MEDSWMSLYICYWQGPHTLRLAIGFGIVNKWKTVGCPYTLVLAIGFGTVNKWKTVECPNISATGRVHIRWD
jgi:hypothetical protein